MIVEIWQLTEENLSFWISLTWFGICRWKEKKILLKSESFLFEKWKFFFWEVKVFVWKVKMISTLTLPASAPVPLH